MTHQTPSILDRAKQLIEARARAAYSFSSEDFNGCLFIDGDFGHFAYEMREPDRRFVALAANDASEIAQALLTAVEALEVIASTADEFSWSREDVAREVLAKIKGTKP